jgi:hypothetical protein
VKSLDINGQKIDIDKSSDELKNNYNILIEKEIMNSIGSRRFGPTYKKKFVEFYKSTNGSIRNYLRSFIFNKIQFYGEIIKTESDYEKKQKLEKELKIYNGLFEEILEIKGFV